ncbi:MAG: DUF58 domain-containing protein [Verrucomicrobiota bacterium]|nr:DUF58 domain-containing protein [Verrucomicrobiota bacterium]
MADLDYTTLLDPKVVSRLLAQPLVTRFPMEGNISGHHKSPHRGSSVEFAEYRNYVPGDDIRRLDWRVFARSDRFYLKEFEAETNLRCYLLLDCSNSMQFSSAHGTRFSYATRLAATLAYLVIQQGDSAGLLCVSDKVRVDIPPKRNPAHVRLLLQTLAQARPEGETGLVPALHEIAEKIRPRALVIILSDLFADPAEINSACQHLRFKKHDVVLMHLLDRDEVDFSFDRPVRFVDLESPRAIVTDPTLVREEYLKALRAHVAQLQQGANESKTDYRQIITDRPYDAVLADFLTERVRQLAVGG